MPSPRSSAPALLASALGLMLVSGYCGLAYEIVWQRYLANLLGSEARASAVVLAVFLFGLAFGYAAFGRMSRRGSPRALIKAVGWIELGIAIWAVLFPGLYALAWRLAPVLVVQSELLQLLVDVLLAALLIVPPTFLMGGTLPLLTQALPTSLTQAGKVHAWIYASNTFGAFLGCLWTGFVIVPWLGLPLTLLTVASMSFVAGVGFLVLGARATDDAPADAGAVVPSRAVPWRPLTLACAGGFVSITLQTLLMRLWGFSAGSSEYTFAIVVALFILMLAVGAASVSVRASQSLLHNQAALLAGLVVVGLTAPAWPWLCHVVRSAFSSSALAFYGYYGALFILLFVFAALPVAALGRNMPLLFESVRDDVRQLGADVGRLYFWNTAGCVLGALVGGYALYAVLDADQVLRVCCIVALGGIGVALPTSKPARHRAGAMAGLGAMGLLVLLAPRWAPERLAYGSFRWREEMPSTYAGPAAFTAALLHGNRVLARRDDPNTTVAVLEAGAARPGAALPSRSILVNGKSDGATQGDIDTVLLLAHLPLLLSPRPVSHVAVIGFGTGMTVGSVALYPEVQQVDCVEISSGVRELAPLFDDYNHRASKSPKLRWHTGDAYRYVASAPERFGIIISEPSNPWVLGVERLYTREFFEAAAARLTDDGLYAQWFHVYDVSAPTFGMVVSTFASVFPSVRIFAVNNDVILLGSREPISLASLGTASARLQDAAVREDLARAKVTSALDLVALELPLPAHYFDGAEPQTLDSPKLAHAAGRDFFRGARLDLAALLETPALRPWREAGAKHSLLAELLATRAWNPQTTTDAVRKLCGERELQIDDTFQARSSTCRSGLAALVARAQLMPAASAPTFLRWLHPATSSDPSDAKDASELLEGLALTHPALRPAGAGELERAGAACSRGPEGERARCRARHIEVLLAQAQLTQAEPLLQALLESPDAKHVDLTVLETLYDEAHRMHEAADRPR